MAKRKSKGRKANVSAPSGSEVEAIAIILMNAVVAAIDDFESVQSFLMGMGSVTEGDIPEGGMEGAERLKENLTRYLGELAVMAWEPKADDLAVLRSLISDFDDEGWLKIRGAEKGPELALGWAYDFAWLDGTSGELEDFASVCKRVLAGSPVASSPEELEQLASVLSVDVEMAPNGKWVASSGNVTKSADSVQEVAKAILTDRAFWSRPPLIPCSISTTPQQSMPPIGGQDQVKP